MSTAKKRLKGVRIIHGVFLLAAVGYVIVPLRLLRVESPAPPAVLAAAFGFTAVTVLGFAVFFRLRLMQAASEALRNNPEDTAALQKWLRGTMISFICSESVVLFGLSLRITGVSRNICGIFYAVGILFLLAWTPKLDLPPE
ncbi:MAG: hypothetical protein ABSG77_17000 [Candidatus Acidiferrum sp.]|jgi:hypothetical protein